MKAIILAAGIASRLRPLTDNTPKCLLKIGDKCLLQRAIDNLIANNITDILIVTGYLEDKIKSFVKETYPTLQVSYIYNDKYDSTNNIYSLWLAKPFIIDDDMLLLDSDILFDEKIVHALTTSKYTNCLALNRHELGEEEIKLVVDSELKIKEISKTCSIKDAIGESIGIEKFSADLVGKLYKELDDMISNHGKSGVFYEAAFENLIQQGAEIYAVDTTQFFSMELDTVDDFNQACNRIPQSLL